MALVTLAVAKTHLHVTTSDRDTDIQRLVDEASAIVIDYLKSRADDTWTDVTVPKPVQAATLLLVGHYDEHRGDDMTADANVWAAVERLLVRYRDPALA